MAETRFPGSARRASTLLANLPIRRRVALVAILPALAALALAAGRLIDAYNAWTRNDVAAAEIVAAGEVGLLVHELQRERGLSIAASAAGAQSLEDRRALAEQRGRVDRQNAALGRQLTVLSSQAGHDGIVTGIAALRDQFDRVGKLRAAVSAGTIAPPQVAAQYTATIGRYVDYVEKAGRSDADAALRDRMVALSALLRAKEQAGLERGIVAGAIAQGALDPRTRTEMARLGSSQDSFLIVFANHAGPAATAAMARLREGAIDRDVVAMRASLLGRARVAPRERAAWWSLASRRVDAMQDVAVSSQAEVVAMTEADAARARMGFFLFALLALGLGGAIAGLVMAVARTLVVPIQRLAEAAEAMTEGDLAAEIDVAETAEEIGQLAARIRQFRDRLRTAEEERAAHAAEREQQIARVEQRARRVDALTAGFDAQVGTALDSFARSTRVLLESARELDERALDSAQRSTAVASASQQTNANVRIVAEATEELSLSIEEVVRQVLAGSRSMADAVAEVQQAHGDMSALRQAADEIGTIVSLIGDIAEQTNILALNATIEAARADAAGYGFAVVAAEVRALANQTADATRSIARSVGEVTAKTRRTGEGMDRIAATIRAAEAASIAISAALEQQSVAARNIAENVQEAACGVAQVDSNIVAIEQANSVARGEVQSVVGAASTFGERAGALDRSVQDFIEAIRAA